MTAPARVALAAASALLRALFALPRPAVRLLAGRPVTRDGQRLAPEAQLLLRLKRLTRADAQRGDAVQSRRLMRRSTALVDGPRVQPVRARELAVPGPAGPVPCRLYEPEGLATPSPLLVFLHGGGWVVGDLDTHDNLCRLLALRAGVRVLAADYRLAPEHRFPAGADDALAVYRWVRAHPADVGADPAAVSLGGDSAGGNLAAVTALRAHDEGLAPPAFLLLLYPGADASVRRRSRELFGDGFLLTDEQMTWFADQYVPDPRERAQPHVSPLLADDLSVLPPTYVATAGFDPLRDEAEAFAEALSAAGVPVVLRRHPDLVHGFASLFAVAPRFAEAVAEAAGALRVGLALATAPRRAADRTSTPS